MTFAEPPIGYSLETERLEIELLMEAVYRQRGYDFRSYAYNSLKRRLWKRILAEGIETVSALQNLVLHSDEAFERLLNDLTVNVTDMFRDPYVYVAFRELVIPLLRTYPFIRIWHAGCSTGEEVYSMAILLMEEGLYDRCRIYATDISQPALEHAKRRIFPLAKMRQYTENYLAAGGKESFSSYYTAAYEGALFSSSLLDNVVFAQHNLATDGAFAEVHLVLCRNVMIYFNRQLQARVHALFAESLTRLGILILGNRETVRFTPNDADYSVLDGEAKIYRKIR